MSQPTAEQIVATGGIPADDLARSRVSWHHRAEALAGLIMAMLFALVLLGVGAVAIYARPGRRDAVDTGWMSALWLAVAVAEFAFLAAMKRAYDLRWDPLPPLLALRQPRWLMVVRPLIVLWWMAHWAAILALGEVAYRFFHVGRADDEYTVLGLVWGLRLLVVFGAAYASNTYLLMAAAAVPAGRPAIELLWRFRIGLDVVLTAGLVFARPAFIG